MYNFAEKIEVMQKYLYILLVGIVIFISEFVMYQVRELHKYKGLYAKELQNVAAYRMSNSDLEGKVLQYQMTIDDLRTSKDSIDNKLINVLKELNIKGKKVEYLQYQTETIHTTDTIIMPDTILVPDVHIDTILGDPWYNLSLQLDYPSSIKVSPSFNSEQYAIIHTKKEYNKPPSKLFFIRWFQKKHTVVEVDIKERSPYVTHKENKFIKIVK